MFRFNFTEGEYPMVSKFRSIAVLFLLVGFGLPASQIEAAMTGAVTHSSVFLRNLMFKSNSSEGEHSMISKFKIIAVLFVLVGLGLPFSKVQAKSSNSTVNTRFEANLDPCCGDPEPKAKGDAEHRTQTQKGAIKDERFRAKVDVPIPNTLGIDESNAQNADIRLILSRGGVDYAECTLVLAAIVQEFEDTGVVTEAEYRVDVRLKKGSVQSAKGSCNPALPEVQSDDTATATLVVNPADRTQDIDFLQGQFQLH